MQQQGDEGHGSRHGCNQRVEVLWPREGGLLWNWPSLGLWHTQSNQSESQEGGFPGAQVHVHEDGVLEISGEFKNVEEKGPVTWHASERSNGRFARQVPLPDNVKVDDVKAAIESGVLTVTIPKKPQGKLSGRNVPVISKL
ncbi:hypothetical protein L7F22_027987 [Adiantum nelumboides]|nr:hypothetical protein [Adiantum nelumboides]